MRNEFKRFCRLDESWFSRKPAPPVVSAPEVDADGNVHHPELEEAPPEEQTSEEPASEAPRAKRTPLQNTIQRFYAYFPKGRTNPNQYSWLSDDVIKELMKDANDLMRFHMGRDNDEQIRVTHIFRGLRQEELKRNTRLAKQDREERLKDPNAIPDDLQLRPEEPSRRNSPEVAPQAFEEPEPEPKAPKMKRNAAMAVARHEIKHNAESLRTPAGKRDIVAKIVATTGFSRAAVSKWIRDLLNEVPPLQPGQFRVHNPEEEPRDVDTERLRRPSFASFVSGRENDRG